MGRCENAGACEFFNYHMNDVPSLVQRLRRVYCETDSYGCACHLVRGALARTGGPADEAAGREIDLILRNMFPHDHDKARRVLGMLGLDHGRRGREESAPAQPPVGATIA